MLVGLDVETALIERGKQAPPLACVALALEGDPLDPDVFHWRHALDVLRCLLQDRTKVVVGANISYDMAAILAEYGTLELAQLIFEAYESGRIRDVQIAQRLIDIALGYLDSSKNKQGSYSLSAISEAWSYPSMEKDEWRLQYGLLREVAIEFWPIGALKYVGLDAKRPVELARAMQAQFDVQGAYPGIFDQLGQHGYTHFCLHLMSCWGLHTHPGRTEAFRRKVQEAIDSARGLLLQHGLLSPKGSGFKRNTKPAKIYMNRVCERLDLEVKLTNKGDISLDADACTQTGDPVLLAYTLWTTQNTLLKRLEILSQGYTQPLQSRFVYPLETSRSSCRHPADPLIGDQLQNAPKVAGYRECFMPRPGFDFLICDFGGMELATIAQVCLWTVGQSQLARLINDGTDLHSWLGARVVGATYEQVMQAKKDGGPKHLLDARAFGKVGNFSFWGMAGPKRIVTQARVQYGVILTLQQAYDLQRAVHETYPEMALYHAYINALLTREDGTIRSLHPADTKLGYRLGDYRGWCNGPAAANGHFQRLGADGSNAALRAISKRCYTDPTNVLFDCRPVIFFHDEIVAEVPRVTNHECAMEAAGVMERAFRQHVPDVHSEIEPVLATCWSKKAQQVWQNERLIPWEPN